MQEIKDLSDRVSYCRKLESNENNLLDSVLIPLAASRVSAGFGSPAQDYIQTSIDLNKELIRHPAATLTFRVGGDSMIDAGIHPNAIIIVDRMVETKVGDIILARIGDELYVKQLFINKDGRIFLMPRNENYHPIEITEDLDYENRGKVIWSINKH